MQSRQRRLLVGVCLLLASLCWLPCAHACPFCRADATGLAAAPPVDEPERALPFQVSGGLDFPTAFYFRGYLQANHGPILQPYLNLFKTHAFSEELVVRPYVSLFNSSHPDHDNRMADMSDVMVGGVATGRAYSLDARYAFFTMNQFMRSDVHELGFKFSYDVLADSCGPSPFSVKPFAGVYFDLFDQEGTENIFINLGLEPAWRCELAGLKIGLSLPMDWGLGANGYYLNADGTNVPFGYFAIGPAASVALPSHGCVQWFLNGSVQYLHLAADSVQQINGGDNDVCIGKAGISFIY